MSAGIAVEVLTGLLADERAARERAEAEAGRLRTELDRARARTGLSFVDYLRSLDERAARDPATLTMEQMLESISWRKDPPSAEEVAAHAAAHPLPGVAYGAWLALDPERRVPRWCCLRVDQAVDGGVLVQHAGPSWETLRRCAWAYDALWIAFTAEGLPVGLAELRTELRVLVALSRGPAR